MGNRPCAKLEHLPISFCSRRTKQRKKENRHHLQGTKRKTLDANQQSRAGRLWEAYTAPRSQRLKRAMRVVLDQVSTRFLLFRFHGLYLSHAPHHHHSLSHPALPCSHRMRTGGLGPHRDGRNHGEETMAHARDALLLVATTWMYAQEDR